MSASGWTLETLSANLPSPEVRRKFWREVNSAPLEELPAAVERWVRAADQLREQRPQLEAILAAAQATGLDPDINEVPAEQMQRWMAPARGRGAA